MQSKIFIIMLGAPGAGKGTQAKMLAKKLCLEHISTGDIFRENIKNQTDLGKKAEQILKSGKLVSDKVTIPIVINYLKTQKCQNGAILDGFPRNLNQAKKLKNFVDKKNISTVVIYIKLNDLDLVKRLSGRIIDKNTGIIYHSKFNPPPTGSNLEVRSDQEIETIKKRINDFHKVTKPLIEFYTNMDILREIDGDQTIENVARDIDKILTTPDVQRN